MHSSGFTELELVHELSVSAGALTDVCFNDSGEWIALASSHAGQLVVWEWRSKRMFLNSSRIYLRQPQLRSAQMVESSLLDQKMVACRLWGAASGFQRPLLQIQPQAVTDVRVTELLEFLQGNKDT